jgi:chromosome segregation ATPase
MSAPATPAFRTVRKGLDPEQVSAHLAALSARLAEAEAAAAASAARVAELEAVEPDTRAAAERLLAEAREQAGAAAAEAEQQAAALVAEAEQRAAALVAEAEQRAAALREATEEATRQAQARAETVRAEADAAAAAARAAAAEEVAALRAAAEAHRERTLAEAEAQARAATEAEWARLQGDAAELAVYRDALAADADAFDRHLATQRQRLAEVTVALQRLLDGPDALGSVAGVEPLPGAVPFADVTVPGAVVSGVPADAEVFEMDIAGELAALADDAVIDEELAREFFEQGTYVDPHWAADARSEAPAE